MKLACIAFDLDGTLVDSAPDILPALNETLSLLGKPVVCLPEVHAWLGNGMQVLLKRALSGALVPSCIEETQLLQAQTLFIERYLATNGKHSTLYPGVPEVLAELATNYPLAVTTNKPRQFTVPLLKALGIAKWFTHLICADDVKAAKPAPDMLFHLATLTKNAPAEMLLVGDSKNDIFAARAAAMPVFALSYGYNHGQSIELSQPDAVLHDFRELPTRIRQFVQEC